MSNPNQLLAALMCAAGLMAISPASQAKGCLKGAAVGAVTGHVAGEHGVVGAVGGCAVGRHMANKKDKEEKAAADKSESTDKGDHGSNDHPATQSPQPQK